MQGRITPEQAVARAANWGFSEADTERIRKLLFDSYSVEADLIGVADFPPLRRSAEDIRDAGSTFVGCVQQEALLAVAELETGRGGSRNIASFAVHPTGFRQGVGSNLLQQILSSHGGAGLTVSTAVRNRPAILLYEKHGFQVVKEWRTDCGIDMVTLAREGGDRGRGGLAVE